MQKTSPPTTPIDKYHWNQEYKENENTRDSEEVYRSIIEEAPYIPGDDGSPCDYKDIPWANPVLIKDGQDFICRNLFSVELAHISALLFGFSCKPLTSVLLRTGGFGLGDTTKSMLRHVETAVHVKTWYNSNILETMGEGHKDVQFVRKLHLHALRKSERTPLVLNEDVPGKEEKVALIEALKKDLDDCIDTSDSPTQLFTYTPKVFMSQYDMLMTQFGFIFIIFLFPQNLGISDTRGLDGFLHMWAVLGKMLGIEDRFNLALHPNREVCLKLFYKIGLGSMKDMDLTILHLQQTYIDAISPLYKTMSLKSFFYFGLRSEGIGFNFKGEHLYKTMLWSDLICIKVTSLITFLIYNSVFMRRCINSVYEFFAEQNVRIVLAKKHNPVKELKNDLTSKVFLKRIYDFIQPVVTIFQRT